MDREKIQKQVQSYLTEFVETSCNRCEKLYDPISNPPMIICLKRHRICQQCFKQGSNFPKKCFKSGCAQIINLENAIKDDKSIIFLKELQRNQRAYSPQQEMQLQQEIIQNSSTQFLDKRKIFLSQNKTFLQQQFQYIRELRERLQEKQCCLEKEYAKTEQQLKRLKRILKLRKKKLKKRQLPFQVEQVQKTQAKDYLNMNYSLDLIDDVLDQIQNTTNYSQKQEICKIVELAFCIGEQMKNEVSKYLPKNIVVMQSDTDEVVNKQGIQEEVCSPATVYVDVGSDDNQNQHQVDNLQQNNTMYAYASQSIDKLLKSTKNFWMLLRIEKRIAQYQEQQFIEIMCEEMKKIDVFEIDEIYKFQGYQTYHDLLNYLLKEYSHKLYLHINAAMASTDPVTISRMRYFLHLMLKNYKEKICGDEPPKEIYEYYRYTKISTMQFKTYSVGGFIFFTALTSCSYQGQPVFSQSPSKNQIRIKYIIHTQQPVIQNEEDFFNALLDITKVSKYQQQKEVLFFPYQIFVIKSITMIKEFKLVEVLLQQIPKKYLIKQIEKTQIQFLSSQNVQKKPSNSKYIIQTLHFAKKELQKNMDNLVRNIVSRLNKQQTLLQKFIQYCEKHNASDMLKLMAKNGRNLEKILYANFEANCKLQRIQLMELLPNLSVLCLWNNQIVTLEGLRKVQSNLRKLLLGKNNIANLQGLQTQRHSLQELSIYDNKLNSETVKWLTQVNKRMQQLKILSISFQENSPHQNICCYQAILELENQKIIMFPKLDTLEIYNSNSFSEQDKDSIIINLKKAEIKYFWYD